MQAKREQWRGFATKTQASHLVFLDESGVNMNVARPYGRGRGGQGRAVDHTPLNTPKSLTILSSILLDGEIGVDHISGWDYWGKVSILFERCTDSHASSW